MKESLAYKHPPNSCQHSYKYLAHRDAIATQLYVSYELTKPSKIMWTHRIRSFHKWFSRLGPPSLLLLHGLPKWALGIFRAKISGTFTATTLLMPQKNPWRPESIAQLWRKHWWPKAMGILRPGRSPSFSCVLFRCFLFLAFACLPNWIGPCCFLKPTPIPIPFYTYTQT